MKEPQCQAPSSKVKIRRPPELFTLSVGCYWHVSAYLTYSPPHVLPIDQASDGETPPAELAESGSALLPSPSGAKKDATEVSSK